MKKKEDELPLTKTQKANAVSKLRAYVNENFETEIGNLQAEIFLEYIAKNIGIYFYNKAVADSLAFISEKTEDMYLLMKDEED